MSRHRAGTAEVASAVLAALQPLDEDFPSIDELPDEFVYL